jgi:energy-dependent translational throttle protein EttA
MIVGEEKPDAGTISRSAHRRLRLRGPVARRTSTRRHGLRRDQRGPEHIVVGNREIHARAYVASFGFKGSDQQKKVGEISGGERNRVQLAKVLRSGGNVLLARRADQRPRRRHAARARGRPAGLSRCAVVISHDRWFLDRIATHVLAFEGDAVVRWFEGNFSDYEAERHKRLGTDADQPHRIRYKPRPRDSSSSATRSIRPRDSSPSSSAPSSSSAVAGRRRC